MKRLYIDDKLTDEGITIETKFIKMVKPFYDELSKEYELIDITFLLQSGIELLRLEEFMSKHLESSEMKRKELENCPICNKHHLTLHCD